MSGWPFVRTPRSKVVKVQRRTSVKNSASQQGDQSAVWNAQPVESGHRVSDVIGRSQVKDRPCGSIQYQLYNCCTRYAGIGRPVQHFRSPVL